MGDDNNGRSPRILALVTAAFGGSGGIATVTRDTLRAMIASRSSPEILVLPREAPEPEGQLPERVSSEHPQPGRIRYTAQAIVSAFRFRPHLVYCNHLFMAPLAGLLAAVLGARLVIHVHGIEIWRRPSRLQARAIEHADAVLCVSRDTRRRVLSYTDAAPERVRVVSNSVGDAFTPCNATERLNAKKAWHVDGRRVILTVARMAASEAYKGHDRVMRALAKSVRSDVVYLVAGEGDDRPRLEKLAGDLGISDRVRFLGRAPPERLRELFAAADLFAMPSSGEGFGVAFLEAMCCGTPAIGLNLGGAVDVLQSNALGICVPESEFDTAFLHALDSCRPDAVLAMDARTRFGVTAFGLQIDNALAGIARDDGETRAGQTGGALH